MAGDKTLSMYFGEGVICGPEITMNIYDGLPNETNIVIRPVTMSLKRILMSLK